MNTRISILSYRICVLLLGGIFCGTSLAGEATAPAQHPEVRVIEAWIPATAPGQDTASVSLRLIAAQEAKLTAVSSPVAQNAELHVMKHEHDMMMMRAVPDYPLPANQEVTLAGDSHIMLLGLRHPLKAGDEVSLTLTLVYADKHKASVTVQAKVRAPGSEPASHPMHNH